MRAGYDDLWGIGELAARAGVTVKTVRFYPTAVCCPRPPAAPAGTGATAPAHSTGSA